MLDAWRAPGREVAVIGLGKSGLAAGLLLCERGVQVYASDSGTSPRHEQWADTLRAAGATVELGGHDLKRIRTSTAAVVAPGVPPDVPPLQAARDAGVPVYAEADLGLTELPHARYVAITGTNGKTTTTSLVGLILRTAGLRAETAGNIGTAVCEIARRSAPPDWLALELSSFQLHDMPHVDPAVAILTNLAPNHLDRYASLEEYYGDKALLFRNATSTSVSVVNADDAAVTTLMADVPGARRRFSLVTRADGWYDRPADALMLGDAEIMPRADLPLLGDHNVANALAAALAAHAVGVEIPAIAEGLRRFRAIAHRVEPIREVNGVLWINDSKSTNVTSTEVAIRALDRPFVLLLGGRHKGEPYTRLAPLLKDRCRLVLAYGEAGDKVEADLKGAVPVMRGGTFDDVLRRARDAAREGDAVLLSPACSSYDMFDNYEQRGDTFRAWVQAL
ncbi:MAG TPA: UDP-N-acetylmuramoyl-L-alanine--D-glutamate ligase [Gemmatimonadales bacterium]|jgi:UDP-N-acetylmuramoylalanine--D-glutamate ligase|nr:UDP-N-acetylmuramoyl-L-alanine--D-glutamate ligase [Gemmatimonadales bacterium]